jgi:ubiquinone/menaquinone biosynthesis C-methylase UbiE
MVVDFCAGAGGKTLAIGALMRSTGRLYAFDTSERRLANLKPRQARSGLSNVHPVWIDSENDAKIKRLAGKIDRVLVDAPCSGMGTLRRNPDLKWRQTPEGVLELNQKQMNILTSAARLLKPGGRLVVCEFSTPTMPVLSTLYKEYLMQALPRVARAVSSNPEAYVYLAESIRAWPDQPTLARRIEQAGWQQVRWRNLTGGVVALHSARKPH